jgi:hypothetical protein
MAELKHAGVVVTPADFAGLSWIDFLRELGLNTLGIHSGGGTGEQVLQRLGRTACNEFREQARAAGLEVEYELHAGSSLLPRELFEQIPEAFVYDAKKQQRVRDHNFCPTNDDALRIVAANALSLAAVLQPSTHRYFFWSDDGKPWCRCRNCAELTDADQELLVANAICRALRAVDPLARVAHLAYLQTLAVPRTIRPEPGVFLEFAPIRRSLVQAIDDTGCEENRRHWRVLQDLLAVFPASEAHVLEYWLDSSLASNWRPPVKPAPFHDAVVARDVKAYTALGVGSITTFAVYIDGNYISKYGDGAVRSYAARLRSALG